jgi:hypothetical protein
MMGWLDSQQVDLCRPWIVSCHQQNSDYVTGSVDCEIRWFGPGIGYVLLDRFLDAKPVRQPVQQSLDRRRMLASSNDLDAELTAHVGR